MTTDSTAALVAAAPPDAVFTVRESGDRVLTVTYGEQLRRLRSTAAWLAGLGVRRGDRVHVALGNGQEFLDVWFATAHLGAVLVPTDPRASADEYRHVLADAIPRVSVGTAANAHVLRAAGAALVVLEPTAAGGPPPPAAPVGRRDPAAILYTSGTTSRPKGVVVTHANYATVGRAVATHLSLTAADRWLVALPMFHANAQYYCVMSALVQGASVAVADRFSASRWGAQAARLGATLGSLFAAPVRMILSNPATGPEGTLRTVLFAQNLTPSAAAEFEARFGTRLVQLYGMTETVLPPTMNPDTAERRWDSIGRVRPDVDLLLADAVGNPVPDGEPGEIMVRGTPGETIAAGYWNNPAATAETFGDGLLRTGDLARRDGDGFLGFVDRRGDMIKRAGENIAAGEVERVLAEHPAIAECAVVGVPDEMYDEAVLLVAMLHPGYGPEVSGELREWCRDRLAAFKIPTAFRFVEELPRTSVGKIRKADLRVPPTA